MVRKENNILPRVDPDMHKHPSSLARLAEIFLDIGGNIFKRLLLLFADISGKWRIKKILYYWFCQKLQI
jgi:hypothetical protein